MEQIVSFCLNYFSQKRMLSIPYGARPFAHLFPFEASTNWVSIMYLSMSTYPFEIVIPASQGGYVVLGPRIHTSGPDSLEYIRIGVIVDTEDMGPLSERSYVQGQFHSFFPYCYTNLNGLDRTESNAGFYIQTDDGIRLQKIHGMVKAARV